MARFGFCGPSYASQSLNADAQICRNWYPEVIESGQGKSGVVLYPTPGLAVFCQLPDSPVRGIKEINGRCFAVAGSSFCELFSDGTFKVLGAVASDGLSVSMTASNIQLAIASDGVGYIFTFATNIFTASPANWVSPSMVAYSDGYFISLQQNSNKFQLSGLLDGITWNPINTAAVSVFPDNIVSMLVDHREAWIFGRTKSAVYYDSGATFPFDTIPGAFIEGGIAGQFGYTKADNSVLWWETDERGSMIARRAQGYTPARISNHAVEYAVQGYAVSSDVICYSYQDQGHTFWVSYFPTANKTLVYDIATSLWHERDHWDNGASEAHRSQCHAFAFGKHLVGDWKSGTVYQMAIPVASGSTWKFADDFGNAIHRVRRAPTISKENQPTFFHSLEIDVEVGLGPQPPLTDVSGNPIGPQLMLRWSNDSGKTWSNERLMDCGQAGNYSTRVIARRLGMARKGRIFEVSTTDSIPWRITDAYLDATPDYAPTERLTAQLRKQA